jgi:YegS/Rv2252/BmrU family lipid kinase
MKETYLIICNPKAGKGKSLTLLAKLEDFLTRKGIEHETWQLAFPEDLNKYSCVKIIGGDGTVNYVLNHFKNILIPIALIKGGTGNDYASLHLGNISYEKQFEVAIQPKSIAVDAGLCNHKIFINGVGIGFDGWVVKKNIGKRFFSGITAYYSTIISLLLFYKESTIEIITPEESWEQPTFMMSVAKGKTYGGGFKVAPGAHPCNGHFDFITIGKIGLFNRFRFLPIIEKGKHLSLPFVKCLAAKKIEVVATHPLQAHLDGEWMESDKFELEIMPKKYLIKSIKYQ